MQEFLVKKRRKAVRANGFTGGEKEIHSKKRRNGRYASEKGLVGVSFQKEKEWAVRVKWRLFRLSSFFF
jgi:hypothetical protein